MKRLTRCTLRNTLALTVGFGVAIQPAHAQMGGKMGMGDVQSMISSWPMESQKAARKVIALHGAPDEASASMLTWHNAGPWKRIIASRTITPHKFPAPHPDCVEEFISYRVPLNKYDDLAMFDGSVNVNRTQGELSARCDSDAHNFLALNLAHDIIMGKRSVTNARAFYGRAIKLEMKGNIHPYLMKLRFTPGGMSSADPDTTTIKM